MPILEVTFEADDKSKSLSWRRSLPPDQVISIGRIPRDHIDKNIEDWNRADWVIPNPEDAYISGCHLYVTWVSAERKLQISRRTKPRGTANPIRYKNASVDEAAIAPGEFFHVGRHRFVLHPDDPWIQGSQVVSSLEHVQGSKFNKADDYLKALSRLVDLPRRGVDDQEFENKLLDLILEELPLVENAAIVEVLSESSEQNPRCRLQRAKQRAKNRETGFRVSNRLAHLAIRKRAECRLHLWNPDNSSQATLPDREVDWTIVSPLISEFIDGWGLYVEGKMPPQLSSTMETYNCTELHDYQKVIEQCARVLNIFRTINFLSTRVRELERFVPPRLLIALKRDRINNIVAPKTIPVTVLFCDLRSSCIMAEDEQQQLHLLQQRVRTALNLMTTAISAEEGVIGDLQGDAAMGFWGWPIAQENQIDRAVKAALQIASNFELQNGIWPSDGDASAMRCGIGIAHGLAVAGALGTSHHIKIDVFGPVVNLAARLEGMTKAFGVRIIVDEPIADHLRNKSGEQFSPRIRFMGKYRPAGMTKLMRIHELLPPAGTPGQNISEALRSQWEGVVEDFLNKKWSKTVPRLEEFLKEPDLEKGAIKILEFIRKQQVPPEDWDGGITLDQK